jgi:hypothetical protein
MPQAAPSPGQPASRLGRIHPSTHSCWPAIEALLPTGALRLVGRAEVHGYRVEQGRHSEAHLVGVRVTVRVSVRARVGVRARVPAKARLGQGYAYGWGCGYGRG